MPAADPTRDQPSEQCALCGDSAPIRGLMSLLDPSVPSPMCFACVFVHTLKGCVCIRCGTNGCIGFVVFEVEDGGRVAPAPICPICIQASEGDEFEAICDRDRSVIPQAEEVG
jgi:hypothetical protein